MMHKLKLRGNVWRPLGLFPGIMVALLLSSAVLLLGAQANSANLDLIGYVDLRIGSQGTQMIPGPAWPFGMVQFSPDTTPDPQNEFNEGYRYEHGYIRAFSLTHFSGAGARAPMDVPMMPTVGPLRKSPVGHVAAYASRFSHAEETAKPGVYAVRLLDTDVRVELGSTPRTGFARLEYPATAEAQYVFNPSGKTFGRPGTDAQIEIDSPQRCVSGWIKTVPINDKANKYTIYFAVQFDRDFTGTGVWKGADKRPGDTNIQGDDCAAYVTFDTRTNPVVQAKVGVSFVSIANARANLRAENPGWDLAAVRHCSAQKWNEVLNRCQVSRGGSEAERELFYTALYRSVLHPNLFNDCNGQYIGFDGKMHTVAVGHNFYANFSLWDVYRSQAALLGMFFPEESSDMVRSLMLDAEQSRHGGLPIWSHNNDDSDIMNGYSADPFIASIYAFGGTNVNLQALKERMVYTAVNSVKCNGNGGWRGLSAYKDLGYCLHGVEDAWTDVSSTLEYCVDDFAIAEICRTAGDRANYEYFLNRAQNWRNLFNPDNGDGGYMQSRKADGSWVMPFNKAITEGFSEGNSAQYTWLVNHNVAGLAQKMGGSTAMAKRLDEFFSKILTDGWNIDKPNFWAGNEPDMQVPFFYNWIGQPWKTQARVRECMAASFQATPNGLHGDDDLGAMYSWYVWCALGLYPEIPGAAGFTLCSPMFERVVIQLPTGKQFTIEASQASDKNRYIQNCRLNGTASEALWLPFEKVRKGGTLAFQMGPEPNVNWGAKPKCIPPSYDGTAPNLLARKTSKLDSGKGWFTVDLGNAHKLTRFVYRSGLPPGSSPVSLKIQASPDGMVWKDIDEAPADGRLVIDRNFAPCLARHVKVLLSGGQPELRLREIKKQFELYGQPVSNLACQRPVSASGFVAGEGANLAVDGQTAGNSKWCCTAAGDKWLQVDLGQTRAICRWVVKHAGAGGESKSANTRDFSLQKSLNGQHWEVVDTVRGNTEDITDRAFPAFQARWVRLLISQGTQTSENTARIYEWELHSQPATQPAAPLPRACNH